MTPSNLTVPLPAFNENNADFCDALIGQANIFCGCDHTVTFDRKAACGSRIRNFLLKKARYAFVERLIGTIRREFLDKTLFWNAVDLQRKLEAFQIYYNQNRFHASLGGDTPAQVSGESRMRQANLQSYRWESYCRGLVQLPVAA